MPRNLKMGLLHTSYTVYEYIDASSVPSIKWIVIISPFTLPVVVVIFGAIGIITAFALAELKGNIQSVCKTPEILNCWE